VIRRRTRRELLLTGAAGALLAPAAARAAGPSVSAATSDADRLRRLISVELLLLFCYRHVLDSSVLQPPARRALAPVPAQEEAHIQALERRLTARGGQAPPPPAGIAEANRYLGHRGVGGRLGQLKGEPDALSLLETLEQVVVGAYFVAMIKLEDPQLVVLAAQIMANDAQHEAVVRLQFPKGSPQEAVPYGLVQGLQ
jgi:hypothetical protein